MTGDLPARHGPIGALLRQPETPQEWARYWLCGEQAESLREHGRFASVPAVPPGEPTG